MVKKCTSPTYAVEVEIRNAKACSEIAEIQRLVQVTDPKKQKDPKKEKEVSSCRYSAGQEERRRAKGHKRADCTKLKAALKKQGNCPECGKSGHLE
eukprot:scaffold13538_cov72-Cyclotella_meneghiniana.AAC.1